MDAKMCRLLAIFLLQISISFATNINVLDSTNLRSSLLANPLSLVMYEASWSPQSQEGKPVLEKIASERKDLFVGSLDCETRETNDLCNDEKIKAYPTIRLYRKEKQYVDFNDDITNEKLVKFLSDPDGYPKIPEADSKETEESDQQDFTLELNAKQVDLTQLEKFVASEKKVIVFYYAKWCPRSKSVLPFIKQHLGVLKESGLTLATCNCDTESHKELCREKMTHLPLFEVFENGKKTFNSEKFFKGIIEWSDETFPQMLEQITGVENKKGMKDNEKDQGENEGEEGEIETNEEEAESEKRKSQPAKDEL